MTEQLDGQVSMSDLGLWFGKTSPEHSAAAKAGILQQSSKRSSASQSRKPPQLMCLTRAGQHGEATATWTEDGAWRGECLTRNTGESPSAAVESRLSQILQEHPPTKYYLTAAACKGILRRAERRGKELPKMLREALERQCTVYKATV